MKTNARPSISVVIPCYMSAGFLEDLVYEVEKEVSQITDAYEVVLVVDGSPDNTWQVAQSLAGERVRALKLSRNFGQHNALLAGIREAKHEVIVTMDDDFQHPPSQIGLLVEELNHGFDLVYGTPKHGAHGVTRNFLSKSVKNVLDRLLGGGNTRGASSFRAFRSQLREGLANVSGPNPLIGVALSWTTSNIGYVETTLAPRAEGKSNYSTRSLIHHALNMITGYSIIPLRLVVYGGLVLGLFGVALLGYELWSYATGVTTQPGFTTLASMIAMFSGAQIIAIGVLGEYLARIHLNSMGKPSYVVSERAD